MMKLLWSHVELKSKGHAVDNRFTEIINLPETMSVSLMEHKVKWEGAEGEEKLLKMFTKRFYRHPSGYSIPLEKHAARNVYSGFSTVFLLLLLLAVAVGFPAACFG